MKRVVILGGRPGPLWGDGDDIEVACVVRDPTEGGLISFGGMAEGAGRIEDMEHKKGGRLIYHMCPGVRHQKGSTAPVWGGGRGENSGGVVVGWW